MSSYHMQQRFSKTINHTFAKVQSNNGKVPVDNDQEKAESEIHTPDTEVGKKLN